MFLSRPRPQWQPQIAIIKGQWHHGAPR